MKKYSELPNQSTLSVEILKFWKEKEIFQKSIKFREQHPTFNFYEGPPSANGMPGIHHVVARTIKDIFCRYKTMTGHLVRRKAGWDTHGLPVELAAEKRLNIKKDDIGKKISIKEYNQVCKSIVFECKDQWDKLTEKIGYWVDMDDPYMTCSNKYIESLWNVIKKIYDKKLIYKGYSIQPYSPVAGTGLSSHELNQQGCYKDVKDTSVTAQFKLKNSKDTYFLAWTTTPWTLPANAALAVGENILYVKVQTFNRYTGEEILVILAKECLKGYFSEKDFNIKDFQNFKQGDKEIPWMIKDEFLGEKLIGQKYDQLMPYISGKEEYFRIISADFVTTTDGTGIVHIAPTFGADDMRVAKKNNIKGIFAKTESGEELPIVDKEGKYVKEITDFSRRYVKKEYEPEEIIQDKNYKSIDEEIAIKLKSENKAFLVQKYEHSYPHCWRTDKPILYYPLDSWFIKTTAIKDRLVELNKKIKWQPEHVGEKRFGNWLENLVDWNISRERFWGTPLPIWSTKNKNEIKCIGSIDELKQEVQKSIAAGFMQENINENLDLHKPYVDDIILVSENGHPMYRESDIIDVWFDSGAMPYAQHHYPFENKDLFIENFPADFIAEGVDQTRGWFFTLHVISTILMDEVAFRRVFVNGLVLDKNGIKMSKRLGNTIDPFQLIEKFGADAIRWYVILNFNISDSIKFDEEGVKETQNKFFGTLENTYKFFAIYSNIDGYNAKEVTTIDNFAEIDKWVISRLHTTIKNVKEYYENFDTKSVAQAIQEFLVDDLSNWYVRQNRKRFWQTETNKEKKDAYDVLFTSLINIAKLMAPIAPFYSEAIFGKLSCEEEKSIHLEDFPLHDISKIDKKLEAKMSLAQQISSSVHAMRKKSKIKVRQPLSNLEIECLSEEKKTWIHDMKDLILSEINIKNLEFREKTEKKINVRPNFAVLNKKFNKDEIKEIIEVIKNLKTTDKEEMITNKFIACKLQNDNSIILASEDLLISQVEEENRLSASFDEITLTLDTQITRDLLLEGIARELVNKIQNLRKEKGFEIIDKIVLEYETENINIESAIANKIEYVSREIQANEILKRKNLSEGELVEIEEMSVIIKIVKN